MKHDLGLHLPGVALMSLSPIITDCIGKDVARVVERATGDRSFRIVQYKVQPLDADRSPPRSGTSVQDVRYEN